ncbi:DUF3426 domain-containing protein [Stutzerimonas tarimensis]|uniref:DUF3426 domain-containing protein n=1 Tax=Stutzerimonas tarimensis TaxID=1507735 RepID=A0ABV7T2L7_9GAMM
MTSFITECPHCSTRFRITPSQLDAARGVVRCGACMTMFDASRHLSDTPPPASPEPPKLVDPVEKPALLKQDDTLWIHDDLDLESMDLDEELSRLIREELRLSQRQLQDAEQEDSQPSAASAADVSLSAVRDEEEPELPAFTSIESDQPLPPGPPKASPRPLLIAQAASAEKPRRHEPSLSIAATPNELEALLDSRPEPTFSGATSDLDEEPLQLPAHPRQRSRWGSRLGWAALCLLALFLLLAQFSWYNFDALARQEQYRPWFERVCPLLGCEVPARVDIEQIRSSNLVVRSHPDFTGALVVDAILYNRAPFPQPFPLLEMRFSDVNGTLIASRRFRPSEYLAGELAGHAQMPPQTPIHISLDILDPGASAVNYSLNFHSPD